MGRWTKVHIQAGCVHVCVCARARAHTHAHVCTHVRVRVGGHARVHAYPCLGVYMCVQGIDTYTLETNHVCRVYSVAAILHVLLMVHITLFSILKSFVLLH
jgi:hypothetical protein